MHLHDDRSRHRREKDGNHAKPGVPQTAVSRITQSGDTHSVCFLKPEAWRPKPALRHLCIWLFALLAVPCPLRLCVLRLRIPPSLSVAPLNRYAPSAYIRVYLRLYHHAFIMSRPKGVDAPHGGPLLPLFLERSSDLAGALEPHDSPRAPSTSSTQTLLPRR